MTFEQAKAKLQELRSWFANEFRTAIDTDDIPQAEKLFSILETSFPRFKQTPHHTRMQQRIEQARVIHTHLAKARVYFAANALAKPEGANALQQLHKVHAIRSDHPEVLKGFDKIYQHYYAKAQQQIAEKKYFAALESISFGLKASRDKTTLLALQSDVKHILKTKNQTDALLKHAQTQLEKGNLLTPANSSAWSFYSKVLSLDAKNQQAQKGIKQIENSIVSKANMAIRKNDYSTADKLLKLAETYYQTSPEVIKARRALDYELKDIVPVVPVIRISNNALTSLTAPQAAINKIAPGQKVYVGFSFKNLTSKQHNLLIKLMNGTATTLLSQKSVLVQGPKGEHFFEMNLPVPGAPDGNYVLEIHLQETRLIKANLFGLH